MSQRARFESLPASAIKRYPLAIFAMNSNVCYIDVLTSVVVMYRIHICQVAHQPFNKSFSNIVQINENA